MVINEFEELESEMLDTEDHWLKPMMMARTLLSMICFVILISKNSIMGYPILTIFSMLF